MLCVAVYTLISSGCYAPAARGVVDSLRHSNAEYRGTSRELGYNGSAHHRPQVSFQNEFQYILCSFKILKKYMHREYILLNGFRKAKKVFTAGFHVPLSTLFSLISWSSVGSLDT